MRATASTWWFAGGAQDGPCACTGQHYALTSLRGCSLPAGEPTAMAASGPTADPQYASGAASYGLSTPEIAGIVFASLGGFIALLSLGALAVGHYRRETRG